MKTRNLMIMVGALLILMSAINSYADDKKCPMCKEHGKMKQMDCDKDMNLKDVFYKKAKFILWNEKDLKLSAEQVKAVKSLVSETKKQIIRNNAEIDVIKVDIKTQIHEPKINVEAVNGLIDKKYDYKKANAKLLVDSLAKLKAQLSEDQMNKLKELWMEKCDK